MFIILEISMLISYLFSGNLGLIVAVIIFGNIWFNKKYNVLNKIILSLILSAPIFQIGIAGIEMSHLFSWYIIFLLIFIIYLIRNFIKENIRFSKLPILLVGIALAIIAINNIISDYYLKNYEEFIQVILMVIPILMVYQQRNYLKEIINEEDKKTWIKYINVSLIATAIATLTQYFIYSKFRIIVGNVTIFKARNIFDLFFKGYSVLSMYLGIGIVLNISQFLEEHKFKNIVCAIICLLGIAVNSSRTGLIVAMMVSVFIILIKSKKSIKNFIIAIFVTVIGLCIFYIASQFILQNREVGSLLNDNGRIDTYIQGITTITSSTKNFLFGIGLASENYGFTWPHNFIIQTTLTMGVIVTSIWVITILYIITYVKNTDFKYIIWHIFISSMLITSFHAMSFITLYIAIAILLANEKNIKVINNRGKNEKNISNNVNV